MQVFEGRGQQVQILVVATAAARAEHGEQRPDPLAAVEKGVIEHLVEQWIGAGKRCGLIRPHGRLDPFAHHRGHFAQPGVVRAGVTLFHRQFGKMRPPPPVPW